MDIIFNRPEKKETRKTLRKNMPMPEALLWLKLKNRQLYGYKFRRQYGIASYVVDFFCPEKNLAIEIDGESHFIDLEQVYDKARERVIKRYGINFLRFTNAEVMHNITAVVQRIADVLQGKN